MMTKTKRPHVNIGKPKPKLFRVYIAQVNQTYVDVRAMDQEQAGEKAYRKWRRNDAHASILGVAEPDGRPPFAAT